MARLFQPTITRYLDSDGRRCLKDAPGARKVSEKSRTWRGEYRDYSGILRTVKLNANKQASRQMLAELERKAAQQKAGLLSPFEEHAQRPLLEHLAEFEQSLNDADNTKAHCKLVATRARTVIEKAGFRFIRDISASKVQRCLADLKKTGKTKSQQTINHYLGAIKQFSRWLIRDRRTDEDRLIFLEGGNVRIDRRLERRELTELEIQYLLDAAMSGKVLAKMSGFQRYALYATALSTGLRASELASLTPAHFDLDAEVPIVRIHAGNEKARRGDVIPLPNGLIEILRPWIENKLKKALLWPGKWASQKRAGKTMQLDLEIARERWINDAESEAEKEERGESTVLQFRTEIGQADFHALRHTYLSRLGRSGVSAKAMQKLARHSTVELTIGRYTHANITDLGNAVQQMTPLPLTGCTGQFRQPNGHVKEDLVALMVAGFSDNYSESVRTADDRPSSDALALAQNTDSRNPCQRKTLDKDCGCLSVLDKAERQGFEPWVPLRVLRFSRPVRSAALPSLRSGCYGDPRVVSTTTHREQTQWSCTGSNLRKNQAARRCGSGATVGNAIVEWRPRAFLSPSTTRSRWLEGSSV